ncbi:PAS domain-containing protein, partial [Rubrivirga sp.]|uniref:PAS domain-containing protein n=1 Tax=Rubrivirga sp. TaxID=1885344 RepID=UPI003C75FD66
MATPSRSAASPKSLVPFRLLVAAGGLLLVVFWGFLRLTGSPAQHPGWAWAVMGVWTVGMVAASFVGTWSKQAVVRCAILHPSVIAVIGTWLGVRAGFDAPISFGVSAVLIAAGLAIAIYARTRKSLQVLTASLGVALSGVALATGGFVLDVGLFSFFVVSVSVGVYMAGIARLVVLDQLRTGRDEAAAQRVMLRSIIDAIPDVVVVNDTEGRTMMRNQATVELLGLSSTSEGIGDSAFDPLPPDQARYEASLQRSVVEGRKDIVHDEREHQINGETAWLRGSRVPLHSSDGSISGVVGVFRDVSVERAAQAEIEAQRKLLRTVVDAIPDHIYVKDTEGRATLRNTASARALGFEDPDESVGRADAEDSPELGRRAGTDDLRVILTGKAIRDKEEPRDQGGWLLTTKVPLRDAGGEVVGLVGVSRDITAWKQAEAELREAKEAAESATRAKSEFLA